MPMTLNNVLWSLLLKEAKGLTLVAKLQLTQNIKCYGNGSEIHQLLSDEHYTCLACFLHLLAAHIDYNSVPLL